MPVGRPEKSFPPHLFAARATSSCDAGDAEVDDVKSQMKQKRRDGRAKQELRKIFVKCGVVSQAEGSAYMECGNTKVLCSISGPKEVPRGEDSSTLIGTVNVSARFGSFARKVRTKRPGRMQDLPTDEELEFQTAVNDALKSCILLEKFPNAQVDVFLTVLEDDGGVLPTSLSCTSLALADAGIEIYDLIVGNNLLMCDEDFYLDPIKEEESIAKEPGCAGLMSCGFMPSLNQLMAVNHTGLIPIEAVKKFTQLLIASCTETHKVLAEELQRRTKQSIKL